VRKVTSADVLEALHRATDLPIIGDSYTHLYESEAVTRRNQPLFDVLSQLADAMRLRWQREGSWLQFRSTSYYEDRLKEVPNRLLSRWAAARCQHGGLPLDELLEIAHLSNTQLDATDMAEGARECFGLTEWGLTRSDFFRPHLRFLAQLTPAQRQEAQSEAGLAFPRMTLAQQQQFISYAFDPGDNDAPHPLEELAGANLRLEYTQPGWYRWNVPAAEVGPPERGTFALSPVREQTRAAALQAALRISPQASETQIVPTELAVTLVYTKGSPRTGYTSYVRRATPSNAAAWVRRFPGERR
jgi:hypothetical protein